MPDQFERKPYAFKKISEITSEDVSVKVLGTVIKKDKDSSSMVLDSGKSAIVVLLPKDELYDKIEIGKQTRVLGTVLPYDGGVELKADMVQDFSNVNKDLYTEIYNKIIWPGETQRQV
ncbi:MAG: hypothetical protein GON13_03195 [Nanoarchaeota archaeon]|nr:hypothetical protein [Nanoarchaeota archaeon]